MTLEAANLCRDVRIPELLLEQLTRGQITAPMLLTMAFLYKWSDSRTGKVAYSSGGGLETVTRSTYSDRTFQDAMKRLEAMGWITRRMTRGSKNSYPITIHNYKSLDDNGYVAILNPRRVNATVRQRGRPPWNKATYSTEPSTYCRQAVGA